MIWDEKSTACTVPSGGWKTSIKWLHNNYPCAWILSNYWTTNIKILRIYFSQYCFANQLVIIMHILFMVLPILYTF